MRIGVRLGPVSLSTSTRSRSRSRPRQPSWHATGHAITPDQREVDFRCHHNHRSQSAALDCASTIRKQIEHGQSLHLITRVRSTPASREAARQRALRQEEERKAKAAQRAQEAQQRAQRREAAAQQRAQQRETLALRRQQQAAERHARRGEAKRQRAEHEEGPAPQRPQQLTQIQQQNDGEGNRLHPHRARRSHVRRSRSWPTTGLMITGAVVLLGLIFVGIAAIIPVALLPLPRDCSSFLASRPPSYARQPRCGDGSEGANPTSHASPSPSATCQANGSIRPQWVSAKHRVLRSFQKV